MPTTIAQQASKQASKQEPSLTSPPNQALGEISTPQIQVKSKQRVADHGEVFTNEREVNAMLDLVKDQTQRIDATFLEPACGTGNFLAEILRRKLVVAEKLAKKAKEQTSYEFNSILTIASLYGIELLPDNVAECRKRLLGIFYEHYQSLFPKTFNTKCLKVAEHILSKNIVCGNALTMQTEKTIDPYTKSIIPPEPLVFTEWKPSGTNRIKRRDFSYQNTVESKNGHDIPPSDLGKQEFIAKPIKDYPIITFPRFLEELGND